MTDLITTSEGDCPLTQLLQEYTGNRMDKMWPKGAWETKLEMRKRRRRRRRTAGFEDPLSECASAEFQDVSESFDH